MRSVLIVDDIEGSARLIASLLAPDGHAVRAVSGGAEALRLIRADPPDLVLMDVMMPRMDGFEACRAIKQERGTRLIPVVLLTSLDDTASRMRGIEAGAGRFHHQAAQRTRAPGTRPLVAPHQGLHRRARQCGVGETTDRPYRAALPIAAAAQELRSEVARGWRRERLLAQVYPDCADTLGDADPCQAKRSNVIGAED